MVVKATIIKVLFAEMYVNVVFVIRCLYSAGYRIALYKNYLLLYVGRHYLINSWCST